MHLQSENFYLHRYYVLHLYNMYDTIETVFTLIPGKVSELNIKKNFPNFMQIHSTYNESFAVIFPQSHANLKFD